MRELSLTEDNETVVHMPERRCPTSHEPGTVARPQGRCPDTGTIKGRSVRFLPPPRDARIMRL